MEINSEIKKDAKLDNFKDNKIPNTAELTVDKDKPIESNEVLTEVPKKEEPQKEEPKKDEPKKDEPQPKEQPSSGSGENKEQPQQKQAPQQAQSIPNTGSHSGFFDKIAQFLFNK